MQKRTRIPKFGSWDSSDGNAAYTEVFEVARATRMDPGNEVLAGRLRNPHPQKVNPTVSQHARKPSSEESGEAFGGGGAPPPPPRRQIDPPGQRILIDDTRYVPSVKPVLDDSGPRQIGHSHSERESSNNSSSVYRSPMHQQGRNGNRTASPAWERKAASEGSSTPGRLRPKSSSMEVSEKAAVLPKFGAWDANDPASADGFTMIFNNARNEKKSGGSVHIPPLGFDEKDLYPERAAAASHSKSAASKKYFCCFQPTGVQA